MEPITIATSFASIVSLIGQYRSERGAKEKADFNEFIQWLQETQHQDLKELLEINTKATISIKALLNEDRELLLAKIDDLDSALASYASKFEGFSELASAIKPEVVLSAQALSILRQFEASGGSKMIQLKSLGPVQYLFLDGNGQLEIDEPRFIEDDINTLIELGLLRQDYNRKGGSLYVYTRAASKLVASIENDS